MNVALYLRKSRAEEISDSNIETLKKHRQILIEFSKKNQFKISRVYEEVVSGEYLSARPQMLNLLNDVKKNLYDAVVCVDIDRLGRGAMSDQGTILETFKLHNTQIITPRKTYDLNNELDEEYTEFETFIARRELKLIKRRMHRGIKKTVEDGGYIPNAPYGYDKTKVSRIPSLTINNEESFFVKMIFDLYVNSSKGCQSIADTINKLGAKSKRLNKFNRSSILHILKNKVYIGKITWNKYNNKLKDVSDIYDGIHPPIITVEKFNKAQEILLKRYHPPYNNGNINNSFAGIIKCANCLNLMQRRPIKNSNIEYLICPKKGCCKSTKLKLIENIVFDNIKYILKQIKLKDYDDISKILSIKEDLKFISNKINQITTQMDNISDLLEQKIYTKDIFTKRYNLMKNRKDTYSKKLDELKKELGYNTNIKKQKNYTAFDAFKIAPVFYKNMILKLLIKEIIYYDTGHILIKIIKKEDTI